MVDKFECEKCGQCCGPVPFTIPMFKRFKDKAQRDYILTPFSEIHVVPVAESGDCVFLDENNLCVIYKDRPKVCRLQGVIPKLPCPHDEGYEDSPYPKIYGQMIGDLLK